MKALLGVCFYVIVAGLEATAVEYTQPFTEKERTWWAIQPVQKPEVPNDGKGWARNEIDRFIHRKLTAAKLSPAPEASPRELARRIYFDLHGLPPTPQEVEIFVNACRKNPDEAYTALVDKLLSHSRYGERWATHWLDVVRYAETDGYRADDFRPTVYLYRDYVIQSLNADKPYDQFVREQLAADEFAYDDPKKLIATAFLRHGIYEWNQRNTRMQLDLIKNEMTDVTGEALLGIGIGCARCHDHKFDPILQKDYYALQAFLSTVWWPEDRKLGTPEQLAALDRWNEETHEVRNRLYEIMLIAYASKGELIISKFPEDVQEIYRRPAAERTPDEEQLAQLVERQVQVEHRKIKVEDKLKNKPELLAENKKLRKQLAELEKKKPRLPDAFISVDVGPKPARTNYLTRSGEVEARPAYLTLLGHPAPKIHPNTNSTGRRTALANWITKPDNPLSTRVIVNRIWQHHFGTGIVPTPNDFGTLGEPPSHPQLLDWLTIHFIEGGWKMKSLHRLILHSATYRQTARREPANIETLTDPNNRLLWRYPPRRLSAEEVRDAMLAVSGELREKKGGPSEDGKIPVPSVYVKKRRNTPDNVLQCFDAPSGFDSAPNRQHTTTPTQALLLINNQWPIQRARALASRILKNKNISDTEIIDQAYRYTYGRKPDDDETVAARNFLRVQSSTIAKAPPSKPEKFPNENGLRLIAQQFSKVDGLDLGKHALWLQPGSRFEQLHWQKPNLDTDSFTIEAIAILDVIHNDASVNTLVSRWNGGRDKPGWAFGITSAKSRYDPRNFILQLIGENTGGSIVYEVVASNLRIPTGKPVYLATSIHTNTNGKSTATFHFKDLAHKDADLQSVTVDFQIASRLQTPSTRLLIGGRDQKGHLWDGQLARLIITPQALAKEGLIISKPEHFPRRSLDWIFNQSTGEHPAETTAWRRPPILKPAPTSTRHTALADLCHTLLNSNEFLYLH